MKYLIQRLDKTIKSFTSFTHHSLIILLLLTMSCTDKKQDKEKIVESQNIISAVETQDKERMIELQNIISAVETQDFSIFDKFLDNM